jgi:hypothetical protein
MNKMNSTPSSVSTPAEKDFEKVLQRIRQTRQKVFAQANTALIELYWQIGETISHKVDSSGWGKGVVSELARYIARIDPEIKGFSDKNLWRMQLLFPVPEEVWG